MANKVKTELLVCPACLEKWVRADSPAKEASPVSQVHLESLEVKVLPVPKETPVHPEAPELQVKRDPTAQLGRLAHKVF